MTDRENEPIESGEHATRPAVPRKPRDPAMTLTTALVVYVFINLVLALPLVIFPVTYFKVIGLDDATAEMLGGMRWVGAVILAWSITAIAVMARPVGRGVFVTAGATQLTLGALVFLYSLSIHEYHWSAWYQWLCAIVLSAGALYMWWARLSGRKVLRGSVRSE